MSLLGEERKKRIIELLDSEGIVKVNQLAGEFNVSTETIRRYLDELEKENILKKVYGGAIKVSFNGMEPDYELRKIIHLDEKTRIGRKAAEFVNDNEVIAIDVGTTTLQMIPNLKGKKNLTVLSNSIAGVNLLIKALKNGDFTGKVIFLGGEVNCLQSTVFGRLSEMVIDMFYPDKAFVAAGGICIDGGLTDYEFNEASLTRKIIKNSKTTILLSDSYKLGVKNGCKIVSMDNVDMIICDKNPPVKWKEELNRLSIEWITV